jgi:DNA-binding CsgD family transcriptional regulator
MKYKPRIYYTETDKALMWDRWQKGESLQSIAQLFGRNHSSVAGVLSRTGGIRPPQRTRSKRLLSSAEREDISRGIVAGHSVRSIADLLGRSPSTVSREINRNGVDRFIVRTRPSKRRGTEHIARRPVNWFTTASWLALWRVSSSSFGHQRKSLVG